MRAVAMATLLVLVTYGEPTAFERAVCSGSVRRYCGHATSVQEAVACLQAHRSRISYACQLVLKNRGL